MQKITSIRQALEFAKTIAVVGLSPSPLRPSHGVAAYLQAQGYRVIPVNPEVGSVLGEKSYPSLEEVPEKIDLADVFRRSEFVPEIVEAAIQLEIPVVWLQEGVVHQAAAARARAAGIFVVMDDCIEKQHLAIRRPRGPGAA